MDCLKFSNWLENRDTYDISEADKALKHSSGCQQCLAKLHFDEKIDELIYKAMKPVDLPESLRNKVELSLDRISEKKSKKKYGWYGAFSAAVAAMVVFALSFTYSPSIPSIDEMGMYVIDDHTHHDDSILVVDNPEELSRLGDITVDYKVVKKQIPEGYTFVGARICPLGYCSAVHLVYTDIKGKRFSLYMIKTKDANFTLSSGRQYSMSAESHTVNFWKDGNYIYAMIG